MAKYGKFMSCLLDIVRFFFVSVRVCNGLAVSLPNSYVDILSKVMVLGGGAFGDRLDHKGGGLMNGISASLNKAES